MSDRSGQLKAMQTDQTKVINHNESDRDVIVTETISFQHSQTGEQFYRPQNLGHGYQHFVKNQSQK